MCASYRHPVDVQWMLSGIHSNSWNLIKCLGHGPGCYFQAMFMCTYWQAFLLQVCLRQQSSCRGQVKCPTLTQIEKGHPSQVFFALQGPCWWTQHYLMPAPFLYKSFNDGASGIPNPEQFPMSLSLCHIQQADRSGTKRRWTQLGNTCANVCQREPRWPFGVSPWALLDPSLGGRRLSCSVQKESIT